MGYNRVTKLENLMTSHSSGHDRLKPSAGHGSEIRLGGDNFLLTGTLVADNVYWSAITQNFLPGNPQEAFVQVGDLEAQPASIILVGVELRPLDSLHMIDIPAMEVSGGISQRLRRWVNNLVDEFGPDAPTDITLLTRTHVLIGSVVEICDDRLTLALRTRIDSHCRLSYCYGCHKVVSSDQIVAWTQATALEYPAVGDS